MGAWGHSGASCRECRGLRFAAITHVKDASTLDPKSDATQKAMPVVTGGRDDAVPAEARGSFPKNPASVYTVDVTKVGSIGMAHVPGAE